MTPDYPAAHSMDTQWFAVDQDGHVALFNSSEHGAVPRDAAGLYEDNEPLQTALQAFFFAGREEDPLDLFFDDDEWARAGLFVYEPRPGWFSQPYERQREPEVPLHIDQLPPELRDAFRGVVLPVRFSDTPTIQPCDYVPGDAWGAIVVGADGHTARPVSPDRIDQYIEEVRDAQRDWPEVRRIFRFEATDDSGTAPPQS